MNTLLEELEKLPLAERMQLVEDLWDSIARSREEMPIPQWQKDALDARRRAFQECPSSGQSWEEAKEDILRTP